MNNLLKEIMKWQKKPALRRADHVCIVEGIKMIREIPEGRLRHLIVSKHFVSANPEETEKLRVLCGKQQAGFTEVTDSDYDKISDTVTPQGVMAVLKSFEYDADSLLQHENGLYILLENLQDPGNLGTIIRASEAAGVTAVIMNEGCADICNPKVIRATMGSFFRVPYAVVPDLKEVVKKIAAKGGASYAAHLKGSDSYDAQDYRGTSAFMIGNESKGLTDELADCADRYVRIPMCGKVESLNAAMAATVLMFEAARQRRNG